MKSFKKLGYIAIVALGLFLLAYLYSVFFKPTAYGSANTMGMMILGLILGGLIVFLIVKLLSKKQSEIVAESSHTVVESMRKVFKIVCAEGQFQEIYNYEQTKKLLKFIPSTKKALVIVKAKVLIGYDFEKCKWELDEENKQMKIVSFPEPEILSLEPDFKYYYFEEDLFNFINREDLEKIQIQGKKQVENAALQSGLKSIAAEQMRTVLTEMVAANRWTITNPEMLTLPLQTATKEKRE
ncbi:MAG: DUF4230 domain-containing protein [Porphyromonadaceae bacterium]|nr:DUF4230 domain-containing protein [Porphyromonadaceae bacterium]